MKATTRFTLDMDPMFQRRLKVTAALKGISMREYCLAAIQKELIKDEAQIPEPMPFGQDAIARLDALTRDLFAGQRLEGDSADLLREARQARTQGQ